MPITQYENEIKQDEPLIYNGLVAPTADTNPVPTASTKIISPDIVGSNIVVQPNGDLTIGDYTGGQGIFWDQSTGLLDILGGLSAGTIAIGTSPNWLKVDADGNLWLGNATLAGAQANTFAVTNAGVLYAKSAIIGGWNVNLTSIYTGTEDHSGYTANAGDLTIYSDGSIASIHAKNFYIDTSGNLFCASATISGAITTTAGSSIATSYLSGLVAQANLNVANRGWTQTSAFSVTDADTIAWGAGTFTSADGTAYSISAGNTGNIVAKTYIYLDTAVSTTAYQLTTTSTTAVGVGKVLIAIAQNDTVEATYFVFNGQGGLNINASNLVASSITATELADLAVSTAKIAALAVTSNELAASSVIAGKIAALTIVAADIAAGTITGAKIAATTIAASNIVSGTITTTQIAATTIVAGNIVAGTITGNEIAASTITAGLISVATLSAISASLGTITAGNITLDSSGFIRGGATGYMTGTGFWLGYDTATYKFHIGNPAGDYIAWDGTKLIQSGGIGFASGSFTRTAADGIADQTIAHGMGKTPKVIKMSGYQDQGSNSFIQSNGNATSATSESCITMVNSASQTNVYLSTIILRFFDGTERGQANVKTLDATNIVLEWTTAVNTNTVVVWEAWGM